MVDAKTKTGKDKGLLASYFDQVEAGPLLTREEEKRLAKRAEEGGQEAREKLVSANLRLVISVAKKYRDYGLDFPDLIQAGNLGLIKGVDKFNWRKGYKLSTYAYWWIRQSILKTLNHQSRTVRVPQYVSSLNRKIDKFISSYKEDHGEGPGVGEIAEKLDLKVEKVRQVRRARRGSASLDKPLGEDREGKTLGELIDDKEASRPEREAFEQALSDRLMKLLEQALTDREKHILKLRYGLEDYRPRTLEETGKVFGISRERIRQLQEGAIEKLQAPEFKEQLAAYREKSKQG